MDLLDYGARTYDPRTARFTEIDRFAEKYFNHSPYSYVAGNPVKYIDINGDSIDVLQINLYDQSNGTNYLEQTTNDLSSQTGLSISMGANGNLEYAKDADGNPVISTDADGNQLGSATAREHMMGMMNGEEKVKVYINGNLKGRSDTFGSGTIINLNSEQIEGMINGTVGVDNRTSGWGMVLMHETFHTDLGGGLRDVPNFNGYPGATVSQMNIIRSELNDQGGNYGQRGSYNGVSFGSSTYLPFQQPSFRPFLFNMDPSVKMP